MKKLFWLFFLLLTTSFPQNVEFNSLFQINAYQTSDVNNTQAGFNYSWFPVPSEVHLGFTYYPLNNFGLSARAGIVYFGDEFTGMEYSILGKYFIFPSVYFMGNYTIHLNNDGGGNTKKWYDVTVHLPGFGAGYKASELISLELLFLKPNDIIIESYIEPDNFRKNIKLDWMIKFGVGFNWQL